MDSFDSIIKCITIPTIEWLYILIGRIATINCQKNYQAHFLFVYT